MQLDGYDKKPTRAGNNAQTHECMDLNKAKLITDLISFTGFIVINRELTADQTDY